MRSVLALCLLITFVRLGRGCNEASLQAAREPHTRGSTRDRAERHCSAGLDRRRDTTVAK
jgi:hypothetical protein